VAEEQRTTGSTRTPWVIASVLGCLVLFLLFAVIVVGCFAFQFGLMSGVAYKPPLPSTVVPKLTTDTSTSPTPTFTQTPTPTSTPSPTPTPTPTATPVYYNLIMRYSKNCLSVQGNQAVEATCSQSTQLWNLPTDAAAGNFQVQLQNTGNCLSASSTTPADPFILKSCLGDGTQLWQKRPSGGYFQLANNTQLSASPTTNTCVDARAWEQPIIQWFCKPWGTDNQLDNQLVCQTTTNVDSCEPPPGVYVTGIRTDPPDPKQRQDIWFYVTFSNTTGKPQSYRWWVNIFDGGKTIGDTSKNRIEDIPPGITERKVVKEWRIGPGQPCYTYTGKAVWRRDDGSEFTFKRPDGLEFALPFVVCPQ